MVIVYLMLSVGFGMIIHEYQGWIYEQFGSLKVLYYLAIWFAIVVIGYYFYVVCCIGREVNK